MTTGITSILKNILKFIAFIEEIECQTSRMMKEREEERRAWLSKDI